MSSSLLDQFQNHPNSGFGITPCLTCPSSPTTFQLQLEQICHFCQTHQLLFSCPVWGDWASQVVLVVKDPPANAGDERETGLIPGLKRSPEVANGNPLQNSCLDNSMDRGAWQATVYRVRHDWSDTAHKETASFLLH